MPVFQQPSHFARDSSRSPSSASTLTTCTTATTTTTNTIGTSCNVTTSTPETEPTSRVLFLGHQVSSHIYAALLIALTAVVLVRLATAKAGARATAKTRGWHQLFSLLLLLLWTRICGTTIGRTSISSNNNISSSGGASAGRRAPFDPKDPKQNVLAHRAGGLGVGGAPETEKATPLVQQQYHHHQAPVWAAEGPVAASPSAPTGAASAGAAEATAPSAAPSAPGAGAAASAGMDHQNQPGSRGVSANNGADLLGQHLPPAAEKALGRPFSRSSSPSSPSPRTPAPGQSDGGPQDRPIMDGDSWSGASAHALPGIGAASAAAAPRANVGANAAADENDSSSTPTSKLNPSAGAFSSAPLVAPSARVAGVAGDVAGTGAGTQARGRGGSGSGSGRGLGFGPDPSTSAGSALDFVPPRQFQFVGRTPLQQPPSPSLFPAATATASASASPSAFDSGAAHPTYPHFEDRRPSYAASIPPRLEFPASDASFIHQPNPDYLSAAGSAEGSGASASGSSGLESGASLESMTTSADLLPFGPSSSPAAPHRRSYMQTVPIGGEVLRPVPIPGSSTGSGSGTTTRAESDPHTFSPSSFPSAAPMLPPPPPGHDYGHDSTFFGGAPHHATAVPSHHGDLGGHGVGGETHEIGVHGEIVSGTDDAGASWKRHTRVYGGGVCLACLANGGGFYGDKVPMSERRPR